MNIKELFVSRFEGGYIIDADFSQLEVIALACLSGDQQLIDDIKSGRDMHCISASFLSGEDYEHIYSQYKAGDAKYAKLRKEAKQPSFQLQYGAGAKSMAVSCGLPLNKCKEFLENYYLRYQGVKAWQDKLALEVKSGRQPTGLVSKGGFPIGQSTIVTATGRRYTFTEYDAPQFMQRKGINISFSPTEMKNYPVQGFATGDIAPHMIGVLYRELLSSPLYGKLLLVNTVHDSIVFDCQADVLEESKAFISRVMATTRSAVEERWNLKLPLGFKFDIEAGHNWKDME